MREFVTELRVLDANKNIFDTDVEYTIPLYQCAYAWEDKQLTQLVEDIADVPDNTKYYICALIVSSQGGKFKVVDEIIQLFTLSGVQSSQRKDVTYVISALSNCESPRNFN